MTTRYCKNCGHELTAGKPSCEGCGQAAPQPAAAVEETRRTAAEIAPPTAPPAACAQCGAVVVPGKRFCRQCGQAVQAETQTVPAIPATDPAAPVRASHAAPRQTLAEFPEESYPAPPLPLAAKEPAWEPVEYGSEAAPVVPSEPATASPRVALSKARAGVLIGVSAALLLAAGGGWAWYAHTHHCANCGTVTPQTPIAQTTAQNTPPASPAAKPSASTGIRRGSGASQAASGPAPKPLPAPLPPPPAQNSASGGHGNPAAPTPAFLPTPAPKPIQNVAGRSGVEHYPGPPVPHGGQVVFHNLPKARLKFSFDNTAWRLTLKPNADGTKDVILTSLIQGAQTNCDLGWQVIE